MFYSLAILCWSSIVFYFITSSLFNGLKISGDKILFGLILWGEFILLWVIARLNIPYLFNYSRRFYPSAEKGVAVRDWIIYLVKFGWVWYPSHCTEAGILTTLVIWGLPFSFIRSFCRSFNCLSDLTIKWLPN